MSDRLTQVWPRPGDRAFPGTPWRRRPGFCVDGAALATTRPGLIEDWIG
jgi:hypothetical protein